VTAEEGTRLGDFRALVQALPTVAIQGYDRDGLILYWNPASERFYGHTAAEAVGKKPSDIILSPEDSGRFEENLREVWDSGKPGTPTERPVRTRGGDSLWVHSTLFPLTRDGAVAEVYCMDVDITARRASEGRLERLNRLYSVLRDTSKTTVRTREPAAIYEEVCRIAVEAGLFTMAWVGMVDRADQLVKPVAHWGREEGYLGSVRTSILEIPEGMGPTGISIREDRNDICQDIENDPRFETAREEALARGYRSNAAFPLRVGGEPVGALTLYAEHPDFFDPELVDLLESMADDVSFATEAIERERSSRGARERLRRSEEYFRSLIENALDIIAIVNSDGTIRYSSPSVQRVLGYKRSELRDSNLFDLVHGEDEGELEQIHRELVENPGSIRGVEFRARHRDGSWKILELVGKGYVDDSGDTGLILNARDVTQRKMMEDEIRGSQETQRALLDALVESAWLIDTDGKVLAVNETGAEKLRTSVAGAVGKSLWDLLPGGADERAMRNAGEVVNSESPVRYEEIVSGRILDQGLYPIGDSQGRVTRLAFISRDITQARRAEDAQRKDRDFVSAVINTTGALVVVTDVEGRIILFNSTCEQVTGYVFEEVRGQPYWDRLIEPAEVAEERQRFEQLISGDAPRFYDKPWITKHGASRTISWSNTVLYEEDGSVGFVIGTGIDITERNKAEAALKESEERYRSVFESTGTAMCIVAEDAAVSFLNQEFERMTGYGADEVEGIMKLQHFVHPDDVQQFESYHRQVRQSGRMVPIHFECRVLDKRGNEISAFANMGLIPGSPSSVVSLIDITREKNYERDLMETAERLKHFLTVASHELRHPVTVVKGYANTLSQFMDTMPREMVMEILGDIDSSVDRLTRYIEELMDVSRVEEGRYPVEKEEVDASELVGRAVEDLQALGSENPVGVSVSPDVGGVHVDPQKFTKLLVILMENAMQFSETGSPIDVTVERAGEGTLVSVLDRGPGIGEEHREKVFDRFYQVEDALHHSTPGIGLGLYIAREITAAHGGDIWCESREGGGTVFRFTVP
jgi:PAS domain S-box-containing protein